MIALFCRLYKTKRMQHMSCILLFCIYIPHYSNYLSIFIRYTPTQTEGHIPCLRHQQLYFSDSPVLFSCVTPGFSSRYPATAALYSGDRIGGSFLIFITSVCAYIYCFTAKIPQRTYGIPVFIKISSCHADYFFPGSRIYLASRRCLEAQVSGCSQYQDSVFAGILNCFMEEVRISIQCPTLILRISAWYLSTLS